MKNKKLTVKEEYEGRTILKGHNYGPATVRLPDNVFAVRAALEGHGAFEEAGQWRRMEYVVPKSVTNRLYERAVAMIDADPKSYLKGSVTIGKTTLSWKFVGRRTAARRHR